MLCSQTLFSAFLLFAQLLKVKRIIETYAKLNFIIQFKYSILQKALFLKTKIRLKIPNFIVISNPIYGATIFIFSRPLIQLR